MAAIGNATVDVKVTGSAIRIRALELALDNSRNGAPFRAIIETAKQFADFMENGTVPDKPAE